MREASESSGERGECGGGTCTRQGQTVNRSPGGIQAAVQQATGVGVSPTWWGYLYLTGDTTRVDGEQIARWNPSSSAAGNRSRCLTHLGEAFIYGTCQNVLENVGDRLLMTSLSSSRCHRISLFQQVSQSNFCPARAASVNCKCCYCKVEMSSSNNGSATKW